MNEILSFAVIYTELQVIILSKKRHKFTNVFSYSLWKLVNQFYLIHGME